MLVMQTLYKLFYLFIYFGQEPSINYGTLDLMRVRTYIIYKTQERVG